MTARSRLAVLLLSLALVLTVIDGFVESWTVMQVIGIVLLVLAIVALVATPGRRPAA